MIKNTKYNAFCTLLEMLEDRKYNIPDEYKQIDINTFNYLRLISNLNHIQYFKYINLFSLISLHNSIIYNFNIFIFIKCFF